MATINKITLPNGSVYDLRDALAQSRIDDLEQATAGGIIFRGYTTTALTDGATTKPITIDGSSYTQQSGDLVIYSPDSTNKELEFIWDGSKWNEFGSTGALKALAFKDTASATYKPTGTVSKPTFSGTAATITVKGTPDGSVAISTATGTANYTPGGTVSKPTFTGTSATVTVKGTPGGSVAISTGAGTANYTPGGTVSTPTVTMNTTDVYSITSTGTLPTCSLPSFSATVANENLTFSWDSGSFNAGTLPSKGSKQTVATTVKSVTQPTFTGTGVELTASFSGTELTSTGSFKPSGSVSQPTFTGSGARLTASFSGNELTSTGSYTPAGGVSQPTFNGTETTITVS